MSAIDSDLGMTRIVVGGEYYFIDCPKRFEWMLEEKLGHDAAMYFHDLICASDDPCEECDKLYSMQEGYESVIRDAVDELKIIARAKTRKDLSEVIESLENAL